MGAYESGYADGRQERPKRSDGGLYAEGYARGVEASQLMDSGPTVCGSCLGYGCDKCGQRGYLVAEEDAG